MIRPIPARLRIAFVYDGLYPAMKGGGERRYHEIARRLAERHDVSMVSWRFPQADGAAVPGTHEAVGEAPAFYGTDGRRTVREAAGFAARLVPHLLTHRYDVIDCSATPYLPVYPTWLAARATRTPMVVTWHEFWGPYWHEYLRDRPAVARAARLAEIGTRSLGDVAVAVSSFTAERLRAAGRRGPIRVVPNGVPIAEIDAAPPAQRADILFVGRLIADKHVDDLLRAVARLALDRPRIRCAIVGEGPERTALEALAASLGIARRVAFLGGLDTAAVFGRMKRSAVLALPSTREGYGITVVEAQAAGAVPVVTRAELSAAEALVVDGMDGLVCEPGPRALAAAIGGLLADAPRRHRMAVAARAHAEANDWSRAAEGMEETYQLLVARQAMTAGRVQPSEAGSDA